MKTFKLGLCEQRLRFANPLLSKRQQLPVATTDCLYIIRLRSPHSLLCINRKKIDYQPFDIFNIYVKKMSNITVFIIFIWRFLLIADYVSYHGPITNHQSNVFKKCTLRSSDTCLDIQYLRIQIQYQHDPYTNSIKIIETESRRI